MRANILKRTIFTLALLATTAITPVNIHAAAVAVARVADSAEDARRFGVGQELPVGAYAAFPYVPKSGVGHEQSESVWACTGRPLKLALDQMHAFARENAPKIGRVSPLTTHGGYDPATGVVTETALQTTTYTLDAFVKGFVEGHLQPLFQTDAATDRVGFRSGQDLLWARYLTPENTYMNFTKDLITILHDVAETAPAAHKKQAVEGLTKAIFEALKSGPAAAGVSSPGAMVMDDPLAIFLGQTPVLDMYLQKLNAVGDGYRYHAPTDSRWGTLTTALIPLETVFALTLNAQGQTVLTGQSLLQAYNGLKTLIGKLGVKIADYDRYVCVEAGSGGEIQATLAAPTQTTAVADAVTAVASSAEKSALEVLNLARTATVGASAKASEAMHTLSQTQKAIAIHKLMKFFYAVQERTVAWTAANRIALAGHDNFEPNIASVPDVSTVQKTLDEFYNRNFSGAKNLVYTGYFANLMAAAFNPAATVEQATTNPMALEHLFTHLQKPENKDLRNKIRLASIQSNILDEGRLAQMLADGADGAPTVLPEVVAALVQSFNGPSEPLLSGKSAAAFYGALRAAYRTVAPRHANPGEDYFEVDRPAPAAATRGGYAPGVYPAGGGSKGLGLTSRSIGGEQGAGAARPKGIGVMLASVERTGAGRVVDHDFDGCYDMGESTGAAVAPVSIVGLEGVERRGATAGTRSLPFGAGGTSVFASAASAATASAATAPTLKAAQFQVSPHSAYLAAMATALDTVTTALTKVVTADGIVRNGSGIAGSTRVSYGDESLGGPLLVALMPTASSAGTASVAAGVHGGSGAAAAAATTS